MSGERYLFAASQHDHQKWQQTMEQNFLLVSGIDLGIDEY